MNDRKHEDLGGKKICPLDTNACGEHGYCEDCPHKKETEEILTMFSKWDSKGIR